MVPGYISELSGSRFVPSPPGSNYKGSIMYTVKSIEGEITFINLNKANECVVFLASHGVDAHIINGACVWGEDKDDDIHDMVMDTTDHGECDDITVIMAA